MSKEIKVPAVGESITEVTVGQWFKKDGDQVEMDEVLCELESDKATFELPAEAAGTLRIKAEEGDTLEIGAVICVIDESTNSVVTDTNKPSDSEGKKESNSAKSTGEIKEMVVPTVGESITEVTLANWIKGDGDYVELDEIIAEVDSDKATFELPAEGSGILRHVAKEGDTLEIGGLICKIEIMEGKPAESSSDSKAESAASTSTSPSKESYATGHASPAASKILAEKGIKPEEVKGTGKDGRITKEDAENAQKKAAAPAKE
ncbi:MAG: E3 binding domain-containing protein, partial [Cyclobacteriaceae bacterium]|nr:E3 binding domain-containing protein [Cyclobacteriaceae bacterium]